MNSLVYQHADTVQIFRLGTTTNKKICSNPKEKIVQTYTYSKNQYEYILKCITNNEKPNFNKFFMLANTNCLDCPFSKLQNGGCYTHKFQQYTGFISQLKSIAKKHGNYSNLPSYKNHDYKLQDFARLCENKYIRFGTYGEPVLIPYEIINYIINGPFKIKNWTGYTHQWDKPNYLDYNRFFMASTHNIDESIKAEKLGFQSFMVVNNKPQFTNMINCPASKESDFKSNCAKCGLCSGTNGKGKKSIYILEH